MPGVATEATLSSIDGKTPALGAAATAAAVPVALASDHADVPIDAGAWATPQASTQSVSNSMATLVMVADASRKDAVLCNESADAIRIGPVSVSAAIGLRLLGDTCIGLATGNIKPQGALYAIQLGIGAGSVSLLEMLP